MKNFPNSGFTLIELMIVLVVLLVLSGGSISAYLKFNTNQTIASDTRQFVAELNRVRTLAASLQYPSGCTSLTGVNVSSSTINNSLSGVVVTSQCSPADIQAPPTNILVSSVFSAPFSITFLPGSGYVSGGSNQTVTIHDTNTDTVTKTISISAYGLVSVQ